MAFLVLVAEDGQGPQHLDTGGVTGTRIMDCCRWMSALGSVFPITMKISQRGSAAPLIHHFRPLITYSSPSRTIEVRMLVASEEATSGSVIANAERILPSSSGSSHRFFCSWVPNMCSTSMFPVSGAEQFMACGARVERPLSSARGA